MTAQTVVKLYGTQENDWSYAPPTGGILNTTGSISLGPASAGKRNYMTGVDISSEVLTNATELAISDGAGGTVLFRCKIPTTGLIYGRDIVFPTPLKGSPGNQFKAWTLTASGTGAVYINAQGYTA